MKLHFAWRGRDAYRPARFSLFRKLYLAFILSLFSLFLPGISFAEALINGGFVSGAISTSGEQDSYTFTANADEYVNLHVVDINNTALYPRITLYAPDDSYLTFGNGAVVGKISNYRLPQSGTYTVVVEDVSSGGAAVGDYELHFASAPDANEHGLLINGGVRTESISVGDIDSYTFTANADEYVNLHAVDIDNTALYPRVWLYAPDGRYLTFGNGAVVGKIANYRLPQSGTYTVLVEDVSSGGDAVGNYELHFASAPDADEHGPLVNGGVRSESISLGDIDSYTFTANADEYVNLHAVDIDNTVFYPRVWLYAPDGRYLTFGNGAVVGKIANYRLPQSGTYTVLVEDVSSGGDAVGNYELHFASAPDADEHGPLVNGGMRSESISLGDIDSYTFTANADEYVNLHAVDIDDTALYPRVWLYAPDGRYLTFGNDAVVGKIANYRLPQSGTYTVLVEDVSSGGDAVGNYELHFASAPDADEHGPLINGGVRAESISLGDIDSYTFTANADEYVNLHAVDIDNTALYPRVWLYAPDGRYLTFGNDAVVGKIANYRLPQSGTYTVLVEDASFGGDAVGDYELHFASAPGANEHGLLIQNVPKTETITTGDLDSYTFEASAGSLVDLSLRDINNTALRPTFYLYGPTGDYLTYRSGDEVAVLEGYQLRTTGTHTVLISDSSFGAANTGDYQILLGLEGDISNSAPVAEAGSSISVTKGIVVNLDGSGSFDTDGAPLPLTYAWEIAVVPEGSLVTTDDLSATDQATTSFMPDVGGMYVASLSVSDGQLEDTDTVTITVENQVPVASVGSDQQVLVGQAVILDGTDSSDGDMDPLEYSWTLESAPDGSSVTGLTNADTAVASLTPDVAGLYGVSLVVSDGETFSDPATVTVTASESNVGPTAVIDAPASVYLGDVVTLNGGDSVDPDWGPDPLTFEWTLQSVPSGSALTAADVEERLTQIASFTPDAEGSYVVQLAVSDGDATATTTVQIQVGLSNQAPIADAGADQSAILGNTVSLDGNGSSDPDNGPLGLTYQWGFVSIPAGSELVQGDIMLPNSELASFIPDVSGSYVLQLEVSDGDLSATDSVTITVEGEAGPMACDLNGDGMVDISDIYTIMSLARTDATGPDDPADWNGDGLINVLDARGCVLECTVPGCGS